MRSSIAGDVPDCGPKVKRTQQQWKWKGAFAMFSVGIYSCEGVSKRTTKKNAKHNFVSLLSPSSGKLNIWLDRTLIVFHLYRLARLFERAIHFLSNIIIIQKTSFWSFCCLDCLGMLDSGAKYIPKQYNTTYIAHNPVARLFLCLENSYWSY